MSTLYMHTCVTKLEYQTENPHSSATGASSLSLHICHIIIHICHIIIQVLLEHHLFHTYYVTSSYILCHIIIRSFKCYRSIISFIYYAQNISCMYYSFMHYVPNISYTISFISYTISKHFVYVLFFHALYAKHFVHILRDRPDNNLVFFVFLLLLFSLFCSYATWQTIISFVSYIPSTNLFHVTI